MVRPGGGTKGQHAVIGYLIQRAISADVSAFKIERGCEQSQECQTGREIGDSGGSGKRAFPHSPKQPAQN